jgi:hypothetical protein
MVTEQPAVQTEQSVVVTETSNNPEECYCESHDVPPQSPLWGYQTSPGINKYDPYWQEVYLGEYFNYGSTQRVPRGEGTAVTRRPATPPPAAYVAPEGEPEAAPPPANAPQPRSCEP